MLISFVLPIYNVRKYLERCIESILIDACDEIEILLVDDGSTDGSSEICDFYSKKYKFIRTIHKQNGGLSDARNVGLINSLGDYIVFIDSDDYVCDSIRLIKKAISESSNSDIIAFDTVHLKNGAQTIHGYHHIDGAVDGKTFLLLQLQRRTMQIPAWQNIYRREYLISNDLFFLKGRIHEDLEWIPRVFYFAKTVFYYPEKFYFYDIRDNSISTSAKLDKNIGSIVQTVNELDSFFERKADKNLFKLMHDMLVSHYLFIFALGNFYHSKEFYLKRRFVIKRLVFKNTFAKSLLYCLNKRFFCYVMNKYIVDR